MYKVTIKGAEEKQFMCNKGQDVLHAARMQGVFIPYGCQSGGCGMCKIVVNEGDYKLGTSSKAVLPMEERHIGNALACKTYPKGDLSISLHTELIEEETG